MTWTTKPRDDAFRALCRTAMTARAAAHEAAPAIASADAMLPLVVEHRDGILKLGRRRLEAMREAEDWSNEDLWHMVALPLAAFLTAFTFTVLLFS